MMMDMTKIYTYVLLLIHLFLKSSAMRESKAHALV
jgi:hypothetical protein